VNPKLNYFELKINEPGAFNPVFSLKINADSDFIAKKILLLHNKFLKENKSWTKARVIDRE
jgi:hypothetical protein